MSEQGKTALHLAFENGASTEEILSLIERPDSAMLALAGKHNAAPEVINKLLGDISLEEKQEKLSGAVVDDNFNMVKALRRVGAKPTGHNVWRAVTHGSTEMTEALLKGYKMPRSDLEEAYDHSSDSIKTPLMYAAEQGNLAKIKALIDAVDDPNFKDKRSGRNALSYANSPDALQTISNAINDIATLSDAASKGDLQTVNEKLNEGVYPNHKNKDGLTALDSAVQNGKKHVVEALLQKEPSDEKMAQVLSDALKQQQYESVAAFATNEKMKDQVIAKVNKAGVRKFIDKLIKGDTSVESMADIATALSSQPSTEKAVNALSVLMDKKASVKDQATKDKIAGVISAVVEKVSDSAVLTTLTKKAVNKKDHESVKVLSDAAGVNFRTKEQKTGHNFLDKIRRKRKTKFATGSIIESSTQSRAEENNGLLPEEINVDQVFVAPQSGQENIASTKSTAENSILKSLRSRNKHKVQYAPPSQQDRDSRDDGIQR